MSSTPPAERRNFLVSAIYGLGAVMSAALGVPAIAYLFSPAKSRVKGSEWVDVADIGKLPVGEPAEVLFRRRRVDGWKVVDEKTSAWIIKQSDSECYALAPGCTHLGCAYSWQKDKKEFLCPCHTSTFSVDGKVTAGPAPRPLDRYTSRVVNGKIQLGPVQISEG